MNEVVDAGTPEIEEKFVVKKWPVIVCMLVPMAERTWIVLMPYLNLPRAYIFHFLLEFRFHCCIYFV